ncbi:hypothetical protein BC833DRAFT_526118 [Globomyces pollinis-pini]|nr:hypothetical protein BC833DRAFT_526118 [Globomyces pollinis-pini]
MSSLNKSSSNSSNSINEEPETEKETNTKKYKRWAGVGAAGVLGGVIIGVSGGLAAPLVAAGLGSLSASLGIAGVASSVAVIGTASGAALVGSIFGITGAGLAGYKLNKHLKDLEEFYFTPLSNSGTCLSYTIVISGWIENLEESTTQWEPMIKDYSNHEIIALSFERESLVKLSAAIYDYIKSNAIYTGAQAGVALTSAAALAFALTIPIGLLTTVSMIDNPWNLTLTKSEMAGRILARSVVATYQGGKRPITLVGHGMGARVIVYCLVELYSMRNDMDVYGLIDSVFLLGAAASLSIETWNEIRQIVAGRFVNCFSKNDWFLHLLFRLHSNPAAGEDEIDIDSIENFDVSERVATHVDYVKDLDSILKLVNYDM